MKAAFAIATWLLTALFLRAQSPSGRNRDAPQQPAIAAEFARLQQRLDDEPRPPLVVRTRLLVDFLSRNEATADAPEVLQAMWMLGGLQLQQLDPANARLTFASVAERSSASSGDLHRRALFGLHQALLQLGERAEALKTLRAIDLRDADAATVKAIEVALEQIDSRDRIEIGQRLPRLAYGIDASGKPLTADRFARGLRLLVFWSVAHPPSQRRLEALATAWQRGGLPIQNLVAYALEDDDLALQRLVDQRQWRFPVVPARGRGYLHPDWLLLRVTAVPTMFVVDGDGTLLARDLTPDRLREIYGR